MTRAKLIDPDDLASNSDLARIFGLTPPAVSNWRKRKPDFPAPVAVVANGTSPLYLKSEVLAWWADNVSPELIELARGR